MSATPKEAAPEGAAPAASNTKRVILFLLAGMLLGGGTGALIVGPRMATGKAAAPTSASAEHGAAEEDEDDGAAEEDDDDVAHGDTGGSGAAPWIIENLIVNPAGSGGQRFLMVSVGVVTADSASAAMIEKREQELRDVILHQLGSRTVEELLDMTRRDSLKVAIQHALGEAIRKPRKVRRVFFPVFTVQ